MPICNRSAVDAGRDVDELLAGLLEEARSGHWSPDPDSEEGFSGANYWPEGMERRTFYAPKGEGHEAKIKARLDRWAELRAKLNDET